METNNKLREALETLVDVVEAWQDHLPSAIREGEVSAALDKANAALAEPVRNCDVGTIEEQSMRFDRVCSYRFTGNCAGCQNPLDDSAANGVSDCALFWAQKPYKEEGEK